MGVIGQNAKCLFKRIGLYEPTNKMWINRPDIRLTLHNSGYRLVGAPDGLLITPTQLITLVHINCEIAFF